jgi:hypothetical protein
LFYTVLGPGGGPLYTCEHTGPDDSDRIVRYTNFCPAHSYAHPCDGGRITCFTNTHPTDDHVRFTL